MSDRPALVPRVPHIVPRGIVVQTYLDPVPGRDAAAKLRTLAAPMRAWAALDVAGVAFHGFTTTRPAFEGSAFVWPTFVDAARSAGLAPWAAFGLDSSDPTGKGERMGAVGATPGTVGVLPDAEGKLEDEPLPAESDHARAVGTAFRALAPDVIVVDQPWPLPTVHRGFPYEAFSEWVDAHAFQAYFAAWTRQYGADRIATMAPRFEASWREIERTRLEPKGLVRPRFYTLESYGYTDVPHRYTDLLVRQERVILWSEWTPQPFCLHALEARQRLDGKVGLYDATGAWAGDSVVRRFQVEHNTKARVPLVVDGTYGPAVDAALFPSAASRLVATIAGVLRLPT